MKKTTLVLISLLAVAMSACVVTAQPPREPGTVNSDGSVYLGWRLLSRNKGKNDRETYNMGAQLGTFTSLRLTTDKPAALAQVTVIFANGEQWMAPIPASLAGGEWSGAIALPGAPRAIHSVVIDGHATGSMHAKVEIHGTH